MLKQQNLVSVRVIKGHKFQKLCAPIDWLAHFPTTPKSLAFFLQLAKEKTGKMSVNSMHWFRVVKVKRLTECESVCVLAKKATNCITTSSVEKYLMMDEWAYSANKSVTLIVYTEPSRSSGSLCTQIDSTIASFHSIENWENSIPAPEEMLLWNRYTYGSQ